MLNIGEREFFAPMASNALTCYAQDRRPPKKDRKAISRPTSEQRRLWREEAFRRARSR